MRVLIPKTSSASDWHPVKLMFEDEGWEVVMAHENGFPDLSNINLICFTGGEDVDPFLYGEENTHSYVNKSRDSFEIGIFNDFLDSGVPYVGICRGGQLLNVLSGGKMIQDIPNHQWGTHSVLNTDGKVIGNVLGDHHQAMVPAPEASILAVSEDGINEVLFYPRTRCLCFQPHPEWGDEGTKKLFFSLLKSTLGVTKDETNATLESGE